MKTTVILIFATLIVATVALTDSQKEKIEKYSKPCREETGADEDLIKRARNGEVIDDPKLKKNLLCVWKKLGMADAEGNIVADKLHERVKAATGGDEEKAQKICDKCKHEEGSHEEIAYQVTKCLHEELPNYSPVE